MADREFMLGMVGDLFEMVVHQAERINWLEERALGIPEGKTLQAQLEPRHEMHALAKKFEKRLREQW